MALDFPNAPTNGQTYTGPNGVIWTWDGTKWANGTVAGAYAPVISPVFTGDPQAPTPSPGDSDTSVATTAFVQAAVATANHNTGRNLIHNPLFNVAQRGGGPFSAVGYTADRWAQFFTNGTQSFSIVDPGTGVRTTLGDDSVTHVIQGPVVGSATAGSVSEIYQPIEGVRRLSGKTVTVSFSAWASSGTPRVGISLDQSFGTGGSPSAGVAGVGQSVVISTTPARYSLTFNVASAAAATLGTNGNDFTNLNIWLSGATSQNTITGSVGVQSNTFTIWGVQLEIGSVATPLEKPDMRYDLANCQRFYQQWSNYLAMGYASAGFAVYGMLTLPTTMRAGPTAVLSNQVYTNSSGLALIAGGADHVTTSAAVTATGSAYVNGTIALSADL